MTAVVGPLTRWVVSIVRGAVESFFSQAWAKSLDLVPWSGVSPDAHLVDDGARAQLEEIDDIILSATTKGSA